MRSKATRISEVWLPLPLLPGVLGVCSQATLQLCVGPLTGCACPAYHRGAAAAATAAAVAELRVALWAQHMHLLVPGQLMRSPPGEAS
jgi:hypothetical protein